MKFSKLLLALIVGIHLTSTPVFAGPSFPNPPLPDGAVKSDILPSGYIYDKDGNVIGFQSKRGVDQYFATSTSAGSFTPPVGGIDPIPYYNGVGLINDGTVSDLGYDPIANTFYSNNATFSGNVAAGTFTGTFIGSISNANTVTNGVYTTGAGTVFLTPTGSAAGLTSFPTLNQSTTGNAATSTLAAAATALATTGTPCSSGYYARGVDIYGNATGCTSDNSGTVTAIGVTTANGVSGTSSGGTTPNLTISLGAITPTSVAATTTVSGTQLVSNIPNGTAPLVVTSTTPVANLNIGGNAATSTALAASGTTCSVGSFSRGVDASGNAVGCTLENDGTVTSVSINTANGVSGTSSGGATPALTIALGDITPNSVAATTTVSGTQLVSTVSTGTAPLVVTSTTPVANLNIGGNAATVTNGVYTTGAGTVFTSPNSSVLQNFTQQGDYMTTGTDVSRMHYGSWNTTASGGLYNLVGFVNEYESHNCPINQSTGDFLGREDVGTCTLTVQTENGVTMVYGAVSASAGVVPVWVLVSSFDSTTGAHTETGTITAPTFVGALTGQASGNAPLTATTSALKGNGSGGTAAAVLNDVGAATADYSINSHKLTSISNGTNPGDAVNYSQLSALAGGAVPLNPIIVANLTGDNVSDPSTLTPADGQEWLVAASGVGLWSGKDGYIEEWNAGTSSWVDVKPGAVVATDRLGITIEMGTATGGFSGKHNQIANVVSATPGSYSYTFDTPIAGNTVLVNGTNSSDLGESFMYNSGTSAWVQIALPTTTTAESGLTKTGTALSVNVDTTTIYINGSNNLALSANGITNTNINSAAGIVDTKLATISTSGKVSNSATTATALAGNSTIVARDSSGNFAAGTITATLVGNATTAASLSATGTSCTAGQFATGIDTSGNATGCATPAGGGTVSSVSVTTANGVSGTVATATTTPAISLTLGAITPTSVAATTTVSGTQLTSTVSTGTAPLVVTSTTPVANLNIGGNAGTVTNGVYTTGAGSVYLAPNGSAAALTSFPTLNQSTTGNAATATALSASGSTCSAGQFATGVTSAGNATGCATPAGTGVTAVSVATANGVSGTSSGGSTPALTIALGNITPTSVAATTTVSGTQLTSTVSTGTAPLVVTSTTPVANLNIGGNAGTVTNGVYTTGAGSVYLAPNGSAAALTSFPTLNQSTTGNAATATLATTATAASTETVTSTSANATFYPGFYSTTAGNLAADVNSALTFNPSTGILSATSFTGAGTGLTGTASSLTSGSANNMTGGAGGSIPYQTSSGVSAMLANGSAGQVLQSNGTTLAPSWVAAGAGTVTSVSVTTANGVSGSVATATSTPAISLTLGNITPTSVATGPISGTSTLNIDDNAAALPSPLAGSLMQIENADATPTGIQLNAFTTPSFIALGSAQGTGASPTALITGKTFGRIIGDGYDGSAYGTINNSPYFGFTTATNTWSATDHGSKTVFYTVPDASVTPTLALTLDQHQVATSPMFNGPIGGTNATPSAAAFTTVTSSSTVKINDNAAALPTPATGTVLQMANADSTPTGIQMDSFASPSILFMGSAQGTGASPTALITGKNIGWIMGNGYDGSAYGTNANSPYMGFTTSTNTWSASDHGSKIVFYTIPDASTTQTLAMTIDQNQVTHVTSLLATGQLDGLANVNITTATSNAANSNLSAYNLNNYATAATAVAYTLPTAAAGKQQCYRNYTGKTGAITVNASASGQFIDNAGVNTASGGYVVSGGALGDSACFIGVDATHWAMYVSLGTWTTH